MLGGRAGAGQPVAALKPGPLLSKSGGVVQLRRPSPRSKQAPVPPKRTSSFRDSTYQDRNPDDEDADDEEFANNNNNNGGLERVFESVGGDGDPKQSTPDTEDSELHSTASVPEVSREQLLQREQREQRPQKLKKARTYPPNVQLQRVGRDSSTALATRQAKKVPTANLSRVFPPGLGLR